MATPKVYEKKISPIFNNNDWKIHNPIQNIKKELVKVCNSALMDELCNGDIKLKETEFVDELYPSFAIQFYYDRGTNKAFIEYEFQKIWGLTTKKQIADNINSRIHNFFYEDTRIFPEIIFTEDGVDERCDSTEIFTPYTIGYWKSLTGKYMLIEDETVVIDDTMNLALPPGGLSNGSPTKPPKKFEDFMEMMDTLNSEFRQPFLTSEQKNEYIRRYDELYLEYHNPEDSHETIFIEKLAQLNEEYNLIKNGNSLIPQLFTRYKQMYLDFFGVTLPDIHTATKIYNYKILNAVNNVYL